MDNTLTHKRPKKMVRQPNFNLFDGMVGSLTHTTDVGGNILSEQKYDAFGNPQLPITNSYAYTGKAYNPDAGLLYLRARYYDPSLGRFISADTYLGRIAEPVTQNRYIYVHNNPLLYTDPSGLRPMTGCEMTGGNCYEPDVNGPYQRPDPVLQATFEYGVAVGSIIPSPLQPLFAYGSTAIAGKNFYNAISQGNTGEAFVIGGTAALQESGNPWVRGTGFLFETGNYLRTINGVPPVDETYREIQSSMPTPLNSGSVNRTPIYLLSETDDGC